MTTFCIQCHEKLARRCARCVKDPTRKPRVVELFGEPEALKTAECGCCVLLRCQRPSCPGTMWRRTLADKTLKLQNQFCTTKCRDLVTAEGRRTRRDVPCSYPKCGKVIQKHPSVLAKNRHVYCNQKCHYLHRQELKAAARRAEEDVDVQALCCASARCRGAVRDHVRTTTGLMACTYCNQRRADDIERVAGVVDPKRAAVAA